MQSSSNGAFNNHFNHELHQPQYPKVNRAAAMGE